MSGKDACEQLLFAWRRETRISFIPDDLCGMMYSYATDLWKFDPKLTIQGEENQLIYSDDNATISKKGGGWQSIAINHILGDVVEFINKIKIEFTFNSHGERKSSWMIGITDNTY